MLSFKKYHKPLLGKLKQYGLRRPNQKIALVVGMLPWKDLVADWIFEKDFVQIQRHFDRTYFNLFLRPFIKLYKPTIYLWGYKAPEFFIEYIRNHNLNVFFLEDGFLRSSPDDDKTSPPLSIVIDSQAPYFDTTRPNDLTDLISYYDFEQENFNQELVQEIFDYFLSHRVSKYNHPEYVNVRLTYGIKSKYRILVLGQVSNDDSLKYGGGENISLINLTQQAIDDYPDAQVIVKPHPMSLNDKETVKQLKSLNCLIIDTPLHLVDALDTIDHVYTITSLGGFEAWLRGKEITVLGKPFYKELFNQTHKKKLNKQQLYYICMNIYPLLFNQDEF